MTGAVAVVLCFDAKDAAGASITAIAKTIAEANLIKRPTSAVLASRQRMDILSIGMLPEARRRLAVRGSKAFDMTAVMASAVSVGNCGRRDCDKGCRQDERCFHT